MKRAVVLLGVAFFAFLTRSAGAGGAGSNPTHGLPSLPGTPPAPSADASRRSAGPLAGLTPQELDERVRRGVVLVEPHGAPVAIGTVLDRDGRVLTALSGLAGAAGADIRYADGSTVFAQVVRSDRASDLALLVPQSLGWTEGLDASNMDPDGAELQPSPPLVALRSNRYGERAGDAP